MLLDFQRLPVPYVDRLPTFTVRPTSQLLNPLGPRPTNTRLASCWDARCIPNHQANMPSRPPQPDLGFAASLRHSLRQAPRARVDRQVAHQSGNGSCLKGNTPGRQVAYQSANCCLPYAQHARLARRSDNSCLPCGQQEPGCPPEWQRLPAKGQHTRVPTVAPLVPALWATSQAAHQSGKCCLPQG